MTSEEIERIAIMCHEANKTYCELLGDFSQKRWHDADEWQRESAQNGVQFAVAHPDAPPSTQHAAWLAEKIMDGWTYGPTKDADAKTHPCMVPYEQLPIEQQRKDALFKAIVAALA